MVMQGPVQTILVPVEDVIPHTALAYAEMLSKAYNKPISLLIFDENIDGLEALDYPKLHCTSSLSQGVDMAIEQQDAVMLVFENNGRRRTIQKQLNACRQLRIPYFFVPQNAPILPPRKVAIPMSFLIEEREKATWGRSLHRYFKSQFTILKPNDKGSRAAANVKHVEAFFDKLTIPYTTLQGKKSSFKNDKEVLALLSDWADLVIVTASREYGLDDQLLGPKELHIIRKSRLALMILNPRDDLYILCGD